MIDKETIHKVLSSLWKNDDNVGKMCYNQALQDAQTAFDSLPEEPVSEELETFAKKESEAFAEREYEIGYIDRNALGKGYYWGCIDGAKWQLNKIRKKYKKNRD